MTTQKEPSKWWQFEQRIKIVLKNRKSDALKDPITDGNKLGIVSTALMIGSSASQFIPVLGTLFLAPPLALVGLVVGALALRHYSKAVYHNKVNTAMNTKIAKWGQNPTPSIMAKGLGNTLKYTIGTIRLGAGVAAITGAATATAAGIAAFGSTALAGTSALAIATNTLAVTTAVIGIANPLILLGAGILAAGIGTVTAVKGKTYIRNIGKKLQKSAQLSQAGKKENANLISRITSGTLNGLRGFAADAFAVAAKQEAKKKVQQITNIPKPRM